MLYRMVIPGRLPGLNDVISANRSDPHKGARLKRDTQEMISWQIKTQIKKSINAPVSMICLWCEPDMRRDPDNIYSGHKFILDALVDMGIIAGDGWKYVHDIRDDHTVDKDNPRVEVILVEREEKGK